MPSNWETLFLSDVTEWSGLFGQTAEAEAHQAQIEGRYADWLRETFPPSWQLADHIVRIAEHLDAYFRRDIDRLQINMPPRHGKTETVTVRIPGYVLRQVSSANVLITGYNERFARRLSRKARTVAAESGIVVARDKSATDEWSVAGGGVVMARGVGSPPTGVGFRDIVIDDPVRKREDAESATFREKVRDWYADDLMTRLEPGGGVILVMTRWHEDDLGQNVLETDPGAWHVLKLPAIDDAGAALWPERWPVDVLNRTKRVMVRKDGERSWEALYQQNPTPREGSLFKVTRLGFVDNVPDSLKSAVAFDIAATEGAGDWTACAQVWTDGERFYVDVRRVQAGPSGMMAFIQSQARARAGAMPVIVPQDPGAAGKALAQQLTQALAGLPVRRVAPTGSKETRATPFAAQVEAGNVVLVNGPDTKDFVEEMRQFPGGKHDDMVDAVSDAFNALTSAPSAFAFA